MQSEIRNRIIFGGNVIWNLELGEMWRKCLANGKWPLVDVNAFERWINKFEIEALGSGIYFQMSHILVSDDVVLWPETVQYHSLSWALLRRLLRPVFYGVNERTRRVNRWLIFDETYCPPWLAWQIQGRGIHTRTNHHAKFMSKPWGTRGVASKVPATTLNFAKMPQKPKKTKLIWFVPLAEIPVHLFRARSNFPKI